MYIVQTYGYYNCPQFPTITEARKHLGALVADSLTRARRNHKEARKHKIDTDCYRITMGPDKQSTIYAHHYIAKF